MALVHSEQRSDPQDSICDPDVVITPPAELDLLGRIRSLKLSRNQRLPPRTPCPSIDFSPHSYTSAEHLTLPDQNTRQGGQGIGEKIVELAHLQNNNNNNDMAAKILTRGTERPEDQTESVPQGSGPQASHRAHASSRTLRTGPDSTRNSVGQSLGLEVKSIDARAITSTRLRFIDGSPRLVLQTVEPSRSQLSKRKTKLEYQPTVDNGSPSVESKVIPSQASFKISDQDSESRFDEDGLLEASLHPPHSVTSDINEQSVDLNSVSHAMRQLDDTENLPSMREKSQHSPTIPLPLLVRSKLSQAILKPPTSILSNDIPSSGSPADFSKSPSMAESPVAAEDSEEHPPQHDGPTPNQMHGSSQDLVEHGDTSSFVAHTRQPGPVDGSRGQTVYTSTEVPSENSSGASMAKMGRTMTNVLTDVAKLSSRASQRSPKGSEPTSKVSPLRLDSILPRTSTSDLGKSLGNFAWNTDEKQHGTLHKLLKKGSLPLLKNDSHLTAKPFHQRKYDRLGSQTPSSSRDAIKIPLKGRSDKPHNRRLVTDTTNDSFHDIHAANAASFDNIIVELETLLQEAISIARNAAEKEEGMPPILTVRNPTNPQANFIDSDIEGTRRRISSDRLSSLSSESNEHSPGTSESGLISSYRNQKRNAGPQTVESNLPQKKKASSFRMLTPPAPTQKSNTEQTVQLIRDSWRNHHLVLRSHSMPSSVIRPRKSSKKLKPGKPDWDQIELGTMSFSEDQLHKESRNPDQSGAVESSEDRSNSTLESQRPRRSIPQPSGPGHLAHQDTITSFRGPASNANSASQDPREPEASSVDYNLRHRHHFSLQGHEGFILGRSHRRAPIARDWSISRKRYVATIACLSTSLVGLIVGVYAGEVPAIQYAIIDEQHLAIMGNVVFFIGIAIPSVLFWPLPLLHGRKPYTVAALSLLLPLQFPQAIAVGNPLSSFVRQYRFALLFTRALAGVVMGFANMNFLTTLLDLFGSSLQSGNPHQEVVNDNDVRRHGGGMGLWLGIWTWCSIGSIGVGFLVGAAIINTASVTWGFWLIIIATAVVLVLNIVAPEVRRSPYRRSITEVQRGKEVSRRVARGEVMMHLYSTGPRYWWEEVIAGHVLCIRMLAQPGFLVMTIYLGWIYGQVVMIVVLLGALTSKYYRFQSQWVGLCVGAIAFGALLAIPFQKASLLSRARHYPPRTDSMTFEKRVTWTSHLVRRALFMILLPFAGLAYTLSSGGPPTPVALPILFAALIGFLSTLAIAECNGLIMETFDTSDLQPGMTGRPRRVLPDDVRNKRTNYSCFPRVTAAFAITQSCAFLIAAAGTGTGGVVERALGAQYATAVVAGVLLLLTLALIGVLTRIWSVQIIPTNRVGTAVLSGPEDEWKPVVIGHPSGTTRRISILELGAMTRWTEIRKRNRLVGPDLD